jgi:peroxiredoxin
MLRTSRLGWSCLSLLLLACSGLILADEPESDKGASPDSPELAAGHSSHGEAFNEGPRQAAYLMPGTGAVSFPTSSKVPQVQEFINQGVGQLHGFWYFEAERSFRQAAALDPDCAIAYWGMAMANVNNTKRAKLFIAEAVKRKAKADPLEQLWIASLEEFYASDKPDPKTKRKKDSERYRQYIRRLENIVQEYPDNLEAEAFLAGQIWANVDHGLPISSHQAVDALISEVLAAEPMHPVHHYRIHLWDDEKPARALTSAAECGQAAPTIAHMWHMPGHTYSKLSRYADAGWQQEAASRVDHAHMIRDRVMPDEIHNYAHNQEWLIRNLNFLGRAHLAVDLAKNMIELPRHPRYNTLQKKGSAHFGRVRLLETLARYELWDELIALADTSYLPPSTVRSEQTDRLRAFGAACFAKGDIERGQQQLSLLEDLQTKAKAEQEAAGQKAAEKAAKAKLPEKKVADAKAAAIKEQAKKDEYLERARQALEGHAAFAKRDYASALSHYDKAGGMSKELLSRVNLAAGNKAKAEQLAAEAVKAGKNQVYPLANQADILFQLDKLAEAGKAFDQLRTLAAQADLDLPIMARLKPLVKQRGLPADWRTPSATADDIGERPPLDSLGPARWHPAVAPDWTLPTGEGKQIALKDYRGKPVIALFYLGYGCVHCVKQLEAFAPLAKDFHEAGIELLGISTDPPEDLKKSQAAASPEGKFAFPLVSDDGLRVFKAYRAMDDFEKKPLHAAILIDGNGLIRWQDIGYEPFTDTAFLLKEAQRLLSFPSRPAQTAPKTTPKTAAK